jgi:hypothetical protein
MKERPTFKRAMHLEDLPGAEEKVVVDRGVISPEEADNNSTKG